VKATTGMKLNGDEIGEWEASTINFIIDSLTQYDTPKQVAKACAYDCDYINGLSHTKLIDLVKEAAKANPNDDRVEHRTGKVETYDVVCGYCLNSQPRPADEVYRELCDYLESVDLYPDEYFSGYHPMERDQFGDYHRIDDPPFPFDYWRLAVFAVPGGSEGWYIHVEVLATDGQSECVFLGKTLREGRQACRYAYRIAEEINWWFNN
jgi:hypothetical protein